MRGGDDLAAGVDEHARTQTGDADRPSTRLRRDDPTGGTDDDDRRADALEHRRQGVAGGRGVCRRPCQDEQQQQELCDGQLTSHGYLAPGLFRNEPLPHELIGNLAGRALDQARRM